MLQVDLSSFINQLHSLRTLKRLSRSFRDLPEIRQYEEAIHRILLNFILS